ncbi:MAG: hypothetical protein AB1489_12485 [Acidobacteriota bacterium]
MGIKNSHELKQLESRRDKLTVEVEHLLEQKRELDRTYCDKKKKLEEINKEIQKLRTTSPEPIVSEHALLRYLERVKGIDLHAIKREILTEQIVAAINQVGSCKISNGNGIKFVVKDRTIISVVDENDE